MGCNAPVDELKVNNPTIATTNTGTETEMDMERAVQRSGERAHLVFGGSEAVGHKVRRLILGDRVSERAKT